MTAMSPICRERLKGTCGKTRGAYKNEIPIKMVNMTTAVVKARAKTKTRNKKQETRNKKQETRNKKPTHCNQA
jgi:hypothetical protein